MPVSTWAIAEPQKLAFDGPVTSLDVRIVAGAVNVVGTEEPTARLEVSAIEGPPLIVTQEGGTLTVAYEGLPWNDFLKWFDRKGWHRSAVVSLAVPTGATVKVGVVGAGAVVSGIRGRTDVRGSAATPRSSGSPVRSWPRRSPAAWRPSRSPASCTSRRSRAI